MTTYIVLGVLALILIITISSSVVIVEQTKNYAIERMGRYSYTLMPGPHLIIPFIDRVAHRIIVLETQMPVNQIEAITKDNTPVQVEVATFYRRVDAEKSVYRIQDVELAIQTTVGGIVRAQIGRIEFDELQSQRDSISKELADKLDKQAAEWGVDITRSEIIDVDFDQQTRAAIQKQMTAERERRAVVTRAEGDKSAMQLKADAELYTAEKLATAKRLDAEAQAFAIKTISEAIKENGAEAVAMEIRTKEIAAMQVIGSSSSAKTVFMPTNMTNALGGVSMLAGEAFRATTDAKGA